MPGEPRRRSRWFRAIGASLCLLWATAAHGTTEQSAPPSEQAETLFLELVINDVSTGRVVRVDHRSGHFYVSSEDLAQTPLKLERAQSHVPVPVDVLPGVDVEYDVALQRLTLRLPADWLPHQVVGRVSRPSLEPVANLGAVFNYDVHTVGAGNTQRVSALTEMRVFDRWGSLTTGGAYQGASGADGTTEHRPARFIRYGTTWHSADTRRLVSFSAGDVITGSLPWTSSLRIGGFTIARNFAARPDLITHPIPQFAGRATVPTTVDVLINERPTLQTRVMPGPFTLNQTPLLDGAGTATVTMTDALGRQVVTRTPFYVATTLLQKGLVDYSLSTGWIRREFGIASFAYGRAVGSGVIRYGLTNFLTVEAHVEGGQNLTAGGLGAGLRIWRLGVVNLATAESSGDARGRLIAAGYTYQRPRFNVALQHSERDAGYVDLTTYDEGQTADPTRMVRRSDQATGAMTMGWLGTLSAGVIAAEYRDTTRAQLVTAAYTRSIAGGVSVALTASRNLLERQPSMTVQFVIPLQAQSSVNLGVARDDSGRRNAHAVYSRGVAPHGGLGWNVAYNGSDAQTNDADVTWRTSRFEARTGVHTQRGVTTQWTNLSGSAVAMGGNLFLANRVHDAFALVDTDGRADVPVLFENQIVGHTNRRGRLFVPNVNAYYPATYAIDPLQLPAGVRVPATEQRVAVRHGSGAIVRFALERFTAATVALVDRASQPLPLGSQVLHRESGVVHYVGWGGIVFIEGLARQNSLVGTTPEGAHCAATFAADPTTDEIARIGPLVCRGQ